MHFIDRDFFFVVWISLRSCFLLPNILFFCWSPFVDLMRTDGKQMLFGYIHLQCLSRTKSHHLFKILFWRIVSPDFCLNDSLELRMIIIVYFYSSMGAWYPWKFWKQWQSAPQGLRKNKQTKNRENLEKWGYVFFFDCFVFIIWNFSNS